jgi:hypothetical protein
MQLPLYMLYIWGWARLFGVSELALRAANIPWFFLGFFAIVHFLRRHPGLLGVTLLLYCLHPFVWYYLDEARPYLMQLSGALLVSGALFTALDRPDDPLPSSWWLLFAAGLTILCGAGLLGVPWAIAFIIVLLRLPAFRRSIAGSAVPALVIFLPLLILLLLYFAWTIKQNVGAGIYGMNLPSMLSVFYEQLGFLGLGPGRAVLRADSLSSTRAYLLPLALLGLPLAWGLILAARRRFGLPPGRLASLLVLTASPVILIFALGFIRHARILARHFTPLFPFILLAQACAVLFLWRSGRPLARATAALIVIALALSSLEIRFAFRHSKDDYRSAAAAATQALAQGKTVWWAAAAAPAYYYHLPIDLQERPGVARWINCLPASFTAPPDEIFLSKPDLTDRSGSLSAFIAARHYVPAATWQTFTLWQAPGHESNFR